MRGLLDVNFIIALMDPDHVFHERSHNWWANNSESGWASCPLTENGLVRLMSNPKYSDKIKLTPGDLIRRLKTFAAETAHEFWPDDVSLRDENVFLAQRIHGFRQLTDLYLLALATKHNGRLVTFDRAIPLSAVIGANAENLCEV